MKLITMYIRFYIKGVATHAQGNNSKIFMHVSMTLGVQHGKCDEFPHVHHRVFGRPGVHPGLARQLRCRKPLLVVPEPHWRPGRTEGRNVSHHQLAVGLVSHVKGRTASKNRGCYFPHAGYSSWGFPFFTWNYYVYSNWLYLAKFILNSV